MAATTTITTEPASRAPDAGAPPGFVELGGRGGDGPPAGVTVQDLLRRRARLPDGHPDQEVLRTRSIEAALPLSRRLAASYRGRGEPLEDLYQVAALALVRAVDGYDPDRQLAFSSYAVPTITGALKRHFRDGTWRMRVPRSVKELAVGLVPANARLTHQLGRAPTRKELATDLGVTESEVALARSAWLAHHPDSLDALPAGSEESRRLVNRIGVVDARFETVVDLQALRPLMAALTVRQQHILALRYFQDLTQAEIAARVGISQMHVSRILNQTLTELRAGMRDDVT